VSRAEYHKQWRKTHVLRAVKNARRQGQEDFRVEVIRLFRGKLCDREMNGLAVARIVELLRAVD
jgi:hypothetical protein